VFELPFAPGWVKQATASVLAEAEMVRLVVFSAVLVRPLPDQRGGAQAATVATATRDARPR
jgi:hypothetical protein